MFWTYFFEFDWTQLDRFIKKKDDQDSHTETAIVVDISVHYAYYLEYHKNSWSFSRRRLCVLRRKRLRRNRDCWYYSDRVSNNNNWFVKQFFFFILFRSEDQLWFVRHKHSYYIAARFSGHMIRNGLQLFTAYTLKSTVKCRVHTAHI